MAKMPDNERAQTAARLMRLNDVEGPALKSHFRELANAADDFIDNFSNDYNQLIPVPARTLFTARQKARALVEALNDRFRLGL